MTKYRSGDQVLLEIPAIVIAAADGFVRVRFGDTEYETEQNSLVMIKRSMHLGDDVVHGGRDGKLAQSLEDGVFLVRYAGSTGADAYGVAALGELQHADKSDEAQVRQPEAPAHVAAKPVVTAPEPARAPTPAAAPAADDTLELTQPLADASDEPAGEDERRVSPGVTEMASSLRGVLDRGGQRRQPLDLEALGTTETVRDVRDARGEMVLGDDMRLQGGGD